MNVDGATEHGGDARGGIFYRADCAPLGDRMLLVISRLDSSTWQPARPNCIAGGEQRLSPRTPLVERGTSPRCSPHHEHTAHVSDLPRCCPARPQLVWSVAHATLIDVLLVSISPWLLRGSPLGYGSGLWVSGYLRVALRTRLSGLFARYGRGSERFCALDAVRVCQSREDAAP